jgi:hypothetical protein
MGLFKELKEKQRQPVEKPKPKASEKPLHERRRRCSK